MDADTPSDLSDKWLDDQLRRALAVDPRPDLAARLSAAASTPRARVRPALSAALAAGLSLAALLGLTTWLSRPAVSGLALPARAFTPIGGLATAVRGPALVDEQLPGDASQSAGTSQAVRIAIREPAGTGSSATLLLEPRERRGLRMLLDAVWASPVLPVSFEQPESVASGALTDRPGFTPLDLGSLDDQTH